jgi:hypothetical protein
MAGETVRIIDVRKLPSPDPARYGKDDAIVLYELAPGARYSVRLPAENLNEPAIKAAIAADIKERSPWQGKALQL